MSRIEPNVFLIGAPKCGTTALARYLNTHPQIVVSDPKEPLYFCGDYPNLRKFQTFDHYLSAFDYGHGKTPVAAVDASVWYLYSAYALDAIHAYNPNAKIIVGLREPADYMYSLYRQQLFGGHENKPSFADAWAARHERRAGRNLPPKCRYADLIDYEHLACFSTYVASWLERFGRHNVFIYSMEELKNAPARVYSDVLTFLGVREVIPQSFDAVNIAKTHKSRVLARLLHSSVFRSGWHQPIKRMFGVRSFGIYARLRALNLEEASAAREDLSDIKAEFREHNARVFSLVGRKLWN